MERFKFADKYFQTELVKESKNPNWKGGYYIAGGYLKVKVKDHPAKDKRSYVLLHRLVMEEYLGRYLKDDEYIHHKDGNKLNNDISNLELIYPQDHAKEHYASRKTDNLTGRFVSSDPKLEQIKIRLFDKDRGCTKEYSLSKLIYTKFKRSTFEYRGMSTGLKDKNGNLIYEGDCVGFYVYEQDGEWYGGQGTVVWHNSSWGIETSSHFIRFENNIPMANPQGIEIIGNVHQIKEV